nr:MAG TPA: hypothetical protein [Caudoviricetes sp.]DAW32178.1 MAG TPA: hypothetical protein [Caudoviricetes sp.]DAZ38293.1 MAG TPA: hypothetical protein [Caudoviricetes sp.]
MVGSQDTDMDTAKAVIAKKGGNYVLSFQSLHV